MNGTKKLQRLLVIQKKRHLTSPWVRRVQIYMDMLIFVRICNAHFFINHSIYLYHA